MATRRHRILTLTAAVITALAAGFVTSPLAHADPGAADTGGLRIGFEQTSVWAIGYTAKITITNDSPTIVDG